MIALSLGKRYERLLFFTAPITLAVMVLGLITVGSFTQSHRTDARCYTLGATVYEAALPSLTATWDEATAKASSKPRKGRKELDELLAEIAVTGYSQVLGKELVKANELHGGCFKKLLDEAYAIDAKSLSISSPRQLVSRYRAIASDLNSRPLLVYGVEIPASTTYDLVGTKIKVDLAALVFILQVALFPVLITWLASLYATRYRESLVIQHATSHADIFPHFINLYVMLPPETKLRKRKVSPSDIRAHCIFYGLVRASLLCAFIAPPVLSYAASIVATSFASESAARVIVVLIATASLAWFSLLTILAEFYPTHLRKTFPHAISPLDRPD